MKRALAELARRCRAATTEFENVPAAALAFLAQHCSVSPDAAERGDRAGPDRREALSWPRAASRLRRTSVIEREADFDRDRCVALPGILKSARLGYDGKGQRGLTPLTEARDAWSEMGRVPCVLEKRLVTATRRFRLSLAAAASGMTRPFRWPRTSTAGESWQRRSFRRVSTPDRTTRAHAAVGDRPAMNYVGVLCIEFFVVGGRGCSSTRSHRVRTTAGHYTIDACVSSQFEQQARVMANLPLGETVQPCRR